MGLILNNVSYEYEKGTSFTCRAIDDVQLKIDDGEFVAIIGKTGAGKSTLLQLMNGLIRPDKGEVYFDGEDIWDRDYNRTVLRGKAGMVFQYPEHQLFESTVIKDVCFGAKNVGMSKLEIELNSYNALKRAGVDERYIDEAPLELSGGMKRRVAIAGILAMNPQIMILDEPCAGLDPEGRKYILNMLRELNEEDKKTIILVSHSMEDVAKYAKRVIVMDAARIIADGSARRIFAERELIENAGLKLPSMVELYFKLQEKGVLLREIPLDENEAYYLLRDAVL